MPIVQRTTTLTGTFESVLQGPSQKVSPFFIWGGERWKRDCWSKHCEYEKEEWERRVRDFVSIISLSLSLSFLVHFTLGWAKREMEGRKLEIEGSPSPSSKSRSFFSLSNFFRSKWKVSRALWSDRVRGRPTFDACDQRLSQFCHISRARVEYLIRVFAWISTAERKSKLHILPTDVWTVEKCRG